MANYKIALKLYQSQAGDENAKVKVSINDITVAENVDVSNTDSENPTLFVYDVADLPDPAAGATTTVKVELLNDFYVDSSNDRNVHWAGCGYACLTSDGNYYRYHEDSAPGARSPDAIITDSTADNFFNWLGACEYQGDENGTIDLTAGWNRYVITSTYVSVVAPLEDVFSPMG